MTRTLQSLCHQDHERVTYLKVGNHKDVSCSLGKGKQLPKLSVEAIISPAQTLKYPVPKATACKHYT